MKLATTTADISSYYQSKSIFAPLNDIKKTGFTHIDLSMGGIIYKGSPWLTEDGWKREAEKCLKIAEAKGLDFCQAHSPYINNFNREEDVNALAVATANGIKACKLLGIENTVVHPIALIGGTPKEFLDENIKFYKQFDLLTQAENVNILMENTSSVWNPSCFIRTGKELKEFTDIADIKNMYICWDTGHGNVQGLNQYDEIVAIGEKLKGIHIHDNCGDGDAHISPLAGTINFDGFVKGLIDVNYKGSFTFEASNTLRRADAWPYYRKNVSENDKLANPTLEIQIKQQSVLYEIGKWMLESYGIKAE